MESDRGAELYRIYLDGNEDALSELIELYRSNLIFFCSRYLSVFADAEDAAAEAFAAIILYPKRYNFKTSFKTYLFAIAKKKAIDRARKLSPFADNSPTPVDIADTETLEEMILRDEEKRELHSAMSSLNEDYRTILHLVYFEDMSSAEAASIMNKNRKQAENLLYRAKKALRSALSPDTNAKIGAISHENK